MKVLVLCILVLILTLGVVGQPGPGRGKARGRSRFSMRNIGAMLRRLRGKIGRPQGTGRQSSNVCAASAYQTEFKWNTDYLCEETIENNCKQGPGAVYDTYDYNRICNQKFIDAAIEDALDQKVHRDQGIREQMAAFNRYIDLRNIYPDVNGCTVCDNKIIQVKRVNYTYPDENGYDASTICHVMHPRHQYIPFNSCNGKNCDMKGIPGWNIFANNFKCVPSGAISLNVWVYCPFFIKQCLQTELQIPTHCNCVEATCAQPISVPTSATGADADGTLNLRHGAPGRRFRPGGPKPF